MLIDGVPISQILEETKPENQMKFLEQIDNSLMRKIEQPEPLTENTKEQLITEIE